MATARLQEKLAWRGLSIFTPAEFRRALGLSRPAAYMALQRYVQQRAILRLRNGLYILSWSRPSPFVIANRLCRPSYVSYDTALSHYHLIPEVAQAYTCATTRRPREIEAADYGFIYHSIRPRAFTGYRTEKMGADAVLIAEPEKALCDYLHHVFLGRRALNERIDWRKVNRKKLLSYGELFRPALFLKWLRHVIP